MTQVADLVAHARRLITEHQSRPGAASSDVANAFAQLQEGRHAADYDLSTVIEIRYSAELVRLAETALADFDAIQSLPETTAFLLADRWTRRG